VIRPGVDGVPHTTTYADKADASDTPEPRKSTVKAILIDPEARTVTDIESTCDLDDLYRLIGTDEVTAVPLDLTARGIGDTIWLNDNPEGAEDEHQVRGYDYPFGGRGVVVGTDDQGESADVTVTTLRSPRGSNSHGGPCTATPPRRSLEASRSGRSRQSTMNDCSAPCG
jgi:hypothetical protein